MGADGGRPHFRYLGAKEVAEVGEGEFRGGVVAGFEDIGEEGAFLSLEGQDFFFDGAGADEFVARDGAALADAVGAVGRLGFGGGIPPWVEVDDGIGAGEVEAGAAGFEREEEDRDFVGGLEAVHFGLASAGGH